MTTNIRLSSIAIAASVLATFAFAQSPDIQTSTTQTASRTKSVVNSVDNTEKINEARKLWGSGKFEEAIKILEVVIQDDPKSGVAQNLIANCYFELANFDKALAHYNAAQAIMPTSSTIHENIANLYFFSGKNDEVIKYATKAIELEKERDYSYYLLGCVYADQEKFELALTNFDNAIKYNAEDASYEFEAALVYMSMKKNDQAEARLKLALKKDPKFSSAQNMLGVIAWNKDDYATAEARFRDAIQANDKVAIFHANLAGALLRQGKKEAAISAAKVAKSLGMKEHWSFAELEV